MNTLNLCKLVDFTFAHLKKNAKLRENNSQKTLRMD